MVASPVLMQAEHHLRPQFNALQRRGVIAPNTQFQMKSFPVNGSSERRYCSVDPRGRVHKSITPFVGTPTVCD